MKYTKQFDRREEEENSPVCHRCGKVILPAERHMDIIGRAFCRECAGRK